MANQTVEIMGDYEPDPSPGKIQTALSGLQNMGFNVTFAPGCLESKTTCLLLDKSAVRKAVSNTAVNFVLVGTGQFVEISKSL